jgi:hypothetical protein
MSEKRGEPIAGATGLDFVQLERTFHELPRYGMDVDSIDAASSLPEGSLSWRDLINGYRLVILAEAGAGKTAEIRNIARMLRSERKRAFFLRLENIPDDLELSFEIGTHAEFREWLEGVGECWILLDSVDEARLRNPRDFELAIRRLGVAIGAAGNRAHIVITGRTTAWRPKTDLGHCLAYLPFAAAATKEHEEETNEDETETAGLEAGLRTEPRSEDLEISGFRIVTLADLGREQVRRFVDARGVESAEEFLDAIERADAWSFTTRPQDLEELMEFWLTRKRIGGRLEMMRDSINRRLSERDQGRAEARPLAMKRVREGAMLLAAATTLSREPKIQVPDGADTSKGIPAKSVLSDWDEVEQASLLGRPIFDEAIYGAVRFHHRSIREYMTAEWFAHLLKRESSRRMIDAMFFREQYGISVVTPALRPILPWLAILDSKIRERIKKVAPEILLEGGDPSQLPLEDRRQILSSVCEQVAEGASQHSIHAYAAVQRFVSPDLTEDVRAQILQRSENSDLMSFMLRMVWLGQLTGALPEVMAIALSCEFAKTTRKSAFRAIRAIADESSQRRVRESFAAEEGRVDRELLAELAEDLPPTADNATWLLSAIARSQPKWRYSADLLGERLVRFIQRAHLDVVQLVASHVLPLLEQEPVIEPVYHEVSQRFEWLLTATAKAAERLLVARHGGALQPALLKILRMLSGARAFRSDEIPRDIADFSNLVSSWSELNQRLFWYDVEQTRARLPRQDERLTDFRLVGVLEPWWSFGENDFYYICAEIRNQEDLDNKLVALSLALDLYLKFGRRRRWREKLKKTVLGTRENNELVTRLKATLRPPARSEPDRMKIRVRKYEMQLKARDAEQEKHHAQWKRHIQMSLRTLIAAQAEKPDEMGKFLVYLFERTRAGHRSNRTWSEYNWRDLISGFGEAVARYFRDSAIGLWRSHKPVLRSEGAPANRTSYRAMFGLIGLEIEFRETPGWPFALTESEILLACRYASYELNGFPAWFDKLFQAHPAVVLAFLLEEIARELSPDNALRETGSVVNDVCWGGQFCWDMLAPGLVPLLWGIERIEFNKLRNLLKILQGSSVENSEIARLAAAKSKLTGDSASAALWFAVWTGVAPEDAVSSVATRLDEIGGLENKMSFAMKYATSLLGGWRRDPTAVRSGFCQPLYLKSLYLLVERHVRREDDIDRTGGEMYSPGLRDDAQDAREQLLEILHKIPGKETFLALHEIATAFPDRPWLAHLAKVRAEKDADLDAILPTGVREIHDSLERTPTNHRELAELANLRLLDLKDDLENGDTSTASILRTVRRETDVRKFIGRELREKALGRYAITQEEELADAKRPDLRFHGSGFDAPVPVELKLASKWSGPALLERLENQLCGGYLRDSRSARGVFVLLYDGEKSEWELPGSLGSVGFSDLVVALRQRWEELSASYPGVDGIEVIGIDLSRRDGR